MDIVHLADDDLERYYLGLITDEESLARIEEHYLGCSACGKRAEQAEEYVDFMRVAILEAGAE